VKYCKDCKFFSIEHKQGVCSCPNVPKVIDPVFGVPVFGDCRNFCAALRLMKCGPDAKWFEPKEATP